MNWIKNKYKLFFLSFLFSVCIVFIAIRPLNSPWNRFIAGDGLGYYAYLPAKYIYHDEELKFNWFNKTYTDNYAVSSFNNPQDNFLTDYKDKKINKYYPGLSYIWLPFFMLGHLLAKLTGQATDGFSLPYQLSMGLASLFYLVLGLFYLRRLLWRVSENALAANFIPVLIFYGTALFSYSVFNNTLSHVYSFTFIVMFVYYCHRFLNDEGHKARYLLLCLLFLLITVFIRPLNVLVVIIIPALWNKNLHLKSINFKEGGRGLLLIAVLILGAVLNQFSIMFKQTGSLFAYTYTQERFDFAHPKFLEALFSYHIGIFVYAPLLLVSLAGVFYMHRRGKQILPLLFFAVLFLYSAWWYWPILKRAMVDYYVIPALLLTALMTGLKSKSGKSVLVAGLLLCVGYYQLKALQMRRGVLSEFETDKALYWRNFLRTGKACIYPIAPNSILESEIYSEDFENGIGGDYLTEEESLSGKKALKLDSKKGFCEVWEYPFPPIFEKKGLKKMRLSLNMKFAEELQQVHVFIRLYNKENKSMLDIPFYLSKEDMLPGHWDLKEFGYELEDTVAFNTASVSKISIAIWNVDGKDKFYVDDTKLEFLLTDAGNATLSR